jgi:multidrug efflux pump
MEKGYHRLLQRLMKMRWLAVPVVVGCFALIYFIGGGLQSELAPLEDRSQFRMSVIAPEGTSYDFMDGYLERLTNFIQDSVPEKNVVISITAPTFLGSGNVNTGFIRTLLSDPSDRNRSQQDIVNMVNRNLSRFPEGKAFTLQEQTISVNRRGGLPVQFVLQHIDLEKIRQTLPLFLEEVNKNPVFQGVDVDLKFNKPELSIQIDRLKAEMSGIRIGQIAEALQLAFSNRRMGYFERDGKQYQIVGQVERKNRDDPDDLKKIYLRNAAGQPVSLDNLVSVSENTTPPTLFHFNRYKSATVSAGLAPGKTVGDGIEAMREIAAKVLDSGFSTALSGTSRDYAESSGNTAFAFMLALLLIYLVLAAQFESFLDPLVIMLTVPLALAGAVMSLSLFGQTLNIFSQIGMIMLIGLVTKNGILIVDFANRLQREGAGRLQAATDAAAARLRPILMTSLAMSLGALPLALSLGEASTSRIPLGIVIVGGILFSLLLTLFVIPAMYALLSTKKKKNVES